MLSCSKWISLPAEMGFVTQTSKAKNMVIDVECGVEYKGEKRRYLI